MSDEWKNRRHIIDEYTPYYDACKVHPDTDTEYHYMRSGYYNWITKPCVKCVYDSRRASVMRRRTLGRAGRKDEKANYKSPLESLFGKHRGFSIY